MKLSRRGFAQAAAALPFMGKVAAGHIGAQFQRDAALTSGFGGTQGQVLGAGNNAYGVNEPKMEHWQAMRLALADPDMKRVILDQLYARHKTVVALDPDIEIMRSFSPMAKVTFQRQRNVERELQQLGEDHSLGFGAVLQKHLSKLMWGDQ